MLSTAERQTRRTAPGKTSGPHFALDAADQSSRRKIASLIFLASFAYLCFFRRYTAMEPDEGIVLQGAQRILHGDVLYRDFFSFYTPASYYLLAIILKLFGNTYIVARTALAFSGAMCSAITYLLAARVCSRNIALLSAVLVTLTALPYRFLVLHNWDSTLLACLALYCAVTLIESPNWKLGFAVGSLASLTCLFEQSKGVGLCFGLGIGFLIIAWLGRWPMLLEPPIVGSMIAGFIWPIAIVLLYFATQHTLLVMLADWLWPLRNYSAANRVWYGEQNWTDDSRKLLFSTGSWFVRSVKILGVSPCLWIPALPLIAAGMMIYWAVQMFRQRAAQPKCAYYVLTTAAISGLLLSVVTVRADIIHFMYLQPLNVLVLAWLLDGRDIPGRTWGLIRPIAKKYIVAALAIMSMAMASAAASAPYKIETRRGLVTMPGKDTVIDYVQSHTTPGDAIFVYPYLPLYYYLTDTVDPTRYAYFQTGLHTSEQAHEIIAQLRSRPPRVVLFESSFAEKIPHSWPSTPQAAMASDPIGDYIARSYWVCRVLQTPRGWSFLYMVPKTGACPEDR